MSISQSGCTEDGCYLEFAFTGSGFYVLTLPSKTNSTGFSVLMDGIFVGLNVVSEPTPEEGSVVSFAYEGVDVQKHLIGVKLDTEADVLQFDALM
jgi:hypothetical protein